MRTHSKAKVENPDAAARIEPSSGNVFDDLGLPGAATLLAKAELVSRISAIISDQGLTQAQAASVLGVNQPKVSALLRGHLDGFSTERLFRFLIALGSDIEISLKPRQRTSKKAPIRVVATRLAG
jgi:predicted XRE-type DNA-binding protein